MRNASFNQPRRQRPASFGPRAEAQFTVDLTTGPVRRGRRHHDEFGRDHDEPGRGRGGRGRGRGFGPGGPELGPDGPGFGPGFGPGGSGRRGPGGPGGRGRGGRGRAARGDVRSAILLLLTEQPMHGYQIIQEITERSSGTWTPSPGAVYPAIGLLTDEGLVTTTADGGRNLASLTDEGRTYVEANAKALGTPWDDVAAHSPHRRHELRAGVEALADAVRQVARVGSEAQTAAALTALENARREIYLILAEAGPAAGAASDGPEGDGPASGSPSDS